MNQCLTAEQLDLTAVRCRELKRGLLPLAVRLQTTCNPMQLPSQPFARYLLEQHGLICIPVEDPRWSAGVFRLEDTAMPVLNTARSRVEQSFAAWELLYAVLYGAGDYDLLLEPYPTQENLRAWSFAALQLENLPLYFNRQQGDFLEKVLRCMAAYQVPYLAVLLRLHEQAMEAGNEALKEQVRQHYKLDLNDLPQRFRELGLDTALVQPSNQIDLSPLGDSIRQAAEKEPEMTRFAQDLRDLNNIVREFRLLMEAEGPGESLTHRGGDAYEASD